MAYSHSQIQLYKKCALQYRYDKIDKLGIYENNIHFLLGSVVHEILEYIYNIRRNLRTPIKQDIINFANNKWQEESQKFVTEKAQTEPDVDHTGSLNDAKHRIDIYIDRYRDTYYPFDQAITDSTEKNISCDITDKIKFRGIIDRIDIIGQTIYIIDYKTNKSIPTNDEDSIKDQLNIYALAIKQKYGDKFDKIIAKVIYIHLQREYEWEITNDIIEETQSKYIYNITQIEHDRFAYQMGDQNAFAPNIGKHCDSCPFQRICPAREHKYEGDLEIQNEQVGDTSIKQIIDKIYILTQEARELDATKGIYMQILKDYVKTKGYKYRLFGNEYKLRIQANDNYIRNNKEEISKLLIEDDKYNNISSLDLDKKKFDNAVRKGELDMVKYGPYVEHKNLPTIGRPSKLKDEDIEDSNSANGK